MALSTLFWRVEDENIGLGRCLHTVRGGQRRRCAIWSVFGCVCDCAPLRRKGGPMLSKVSRGRPTFRWHYTLSMNILPSYQTGYPGSHRRGVSRGAGPFLSCVFFALPSSCGACLYFRRVRVSAVPFPRQQWRRWVCSRVFSRFSHEQNPRSLYTLPRKELSTQPSEGFEGTNWTPPGRPVTMHFKI